MARPSGFYCRVFIPADLQPLFGKRYLVRALGARDRDGARLLAAEFAVEVGAAFRRMRQEGLMAKPPSVQDVLRNLQSDGARELVVRRGPGGAIELDIQSDEDEARAKRLYPEFFTKGGSVPTGPVDTRFRQRNAHAVPVSKRREGFIERLKDENSTVKYQRECDDAIHMLIDIAGDLPPDDYDPDIIDNVVKRLGFLPLNPDKDPERRDYWKKRNHLERSREVELLDLPRISRTTVKKHVARLSAFFAHCIERKFMEGPHNPMHNRLPKPKRTKGNAPAVMAERLPFTKSDLESIFDPARYKTRKGPHMFWPPLIAMMTGARVNEIAQWYLDDIVDDDPQKPGRWRFMVLPKRPDQRVKNEPSIRSIPMHPKLIELGFLDYLEEVRSLGFDRVFPNIDYTPEQGYGGDVSERFMTYLRNQVGIEEPKKVFHSFRHYFCTAMFNLPGAERMHVVELTGHQRAGVFETSYARELYWDNKMALLERLPLPELKVPRYQKGTFTKFMKALEQNRAAAKRRNEAKAAKNAEGDGVQTDNPDGSNTSGASVPQFTIKRKRAQK
jgi:integrase